jgi:hypothetical protein
MNRLPFHLSVAMLVVIVGCQQPVAERDTSKTTSAVSKQTPPILAADLRADVEYIASDECAGRLTGSPGAARAAQYIAAAFRDAGLQPIGAKEGYFQPFEFTAGVKMTSGKNDMAVLEGPDAAVPCELNKDFRPLAFSANGTAEGDVVFVGYGLVEPQSAGKGYDSYAGLDVTGKIVLALRHLPENASPQRRQELSLYGQDRYKAKLAADRGAKGFMLITGPNSPNSGELVKLREEDRESSGLIVSVSISGALADRLLSKAGLDLKSLQTMQDGEQANPHATSAVSGARVRISTELERVLKTCRNVIGVLPPVGGSSEYIVAGAHYDHIGNGIGLGSLARQGEEGQIHHGADDNASGVSAVLELAAAIADARRHGDAGKPQRGVIFACWSGEELGLIGSSHFVSHPVVPLDKVVAYFNFDMVGRLRDNKLILQAIGSSPAWRDLIERRNAAAGFDLVLQEDPYLPSDATAFYTRGLPVLAFFTSSHDDYNRPTDAAGTLNYEGLERITGFAKCLVDDTVQPDVKIAYARVQRAAPAGGRGGARAYTGTVPDFTGTDVKGARIADVRAGGPADKAGMKRGDIIVEFAGQKITGLQDYSDALIGVKAGQPVDIVVERGSERVKLTITPTTRPE